MDFVKLLLDRGANPKVVMKGGIGAFFLAVQGPSLEVASLFLEKVGEGTDVQSPRTPTRFIRRLHSSAVLKGVSRVPGTL